ncbi:FHA domain-containing protein [Corynebacterium incognita]|uniref:FHA domain-containing protein n=1 Tax=Corynebacterium incognita TaxID=2754725 RepID=A0A7G7CM31_9CORY|nr:FHA domain-containing protein [Corynebacterium incognita]QNE88647.1 FHA domain-containing protein [Corynebacterium incognita]
MDSVLMLVLRIALLVALWLFILFALNAMRKDTNKAAGTQAATKKAPLRKETPKTIAIVEGPLKGSHMPLGALEEIVVGRANDCDFVLGDDFASSRHARLFRRGSEWFVEDLESRNGTFVGGTRIDQAERITANTDIKFGRSIVRLVP